MPVEEKHAACLVLCDQRYGQHRAQLEQSDGRKADALVLAGVADGHGRPGSGRQGHVGKIAIENLVPSTSGP